MAIRLALNPDTTPLSVSDVLVFKSVEERIREAAAAGFPAVNVDEENGLTPSRAKQMLAEHGLQVASSFFHGRFYNREEEEEIYREAVRKAVFSRELGREVLFVSAWVYPPERYAIAGRVRPGEPVSLDQSQFEQMGRVLDRIGRLWREHGITMCFHPHAATYVEAPHEIEHLLEVTDPDLVRFGPDTGHLTYGGADALAMIERHLDRVGGLHLKDVRNEVLAQVRAEKLNFRQATARGVWTELGTGDIDFPALFSMLRERGWSGWVIVETDHTRLPTALESSIASRRYLKDVIGL